MGSSEQTAARVAVSSRCPACGSVFPNDAAFCPFDASRLEGSPLPAGSRSLLGEEIDGRYAVLELIGEGGMGRVYKVVHRSLARTFAMKVLRPELASDALLAHRFLHEAQATASIRHPNVVQITDFGRLPDQAPYFIMELLLGETLGQRMRRAFLSHRDAVHIVQRCAAGLAAAHDVGVIHRDLKPDNVFLVAGEGASSKEDVRVVDFGASKRLGVSGITRTGIVYGSPHYMAPEQARGQPVDARADVYALGAIMYEMFAGRTPFEGDTYMGVLTQHLFVEPVPPSQIQPRARDLGPLEAILLRCLAKDPAKRFPTMRALLEVLEQTEPQGLSVRAREDHSAGRLVDGRGEANGVRGSAETRAAELPTPPPSVVNVAPNVEPKEGLRTTSSLRVGLVIGLGLTLLAAFGLALVLALRARGSSGMPSFSAQAGPPESVERTHPPHVASVAASALRFGTNAPPLPQPATSTYPPAVTTSVRTSVRPRAPATEAATVTPPEKLDDIGDPFAEPTRSER